MVYFVIAGIFDCENFNHVCHVADYLQSKLPNIHLQKLPIHRMDWGNWLDTVNENNNWHHAQSPLVYKELQGFGTVPHLIGGISEFWEYCWDYYGLESILSAEEIENLKKDSAAYYEREKTSDDPKSYYRHVLIYGPKTRYLWLLVAELFEVKGLPKSKGFNIRFYKELGPEEFTGNEFDDVISFLKTEYNTKASNPEYLEDAVANCELVIITEHFEKGNAKGVPMQLITMNHLADVINHKGHQSVKIVFANYGAACLPATHLANKVNTPNVVVVTSDKGLLPLRVVAGALNVDIAKLSGPPVWGFIGHNKVIDLGKILKKCNVYKPHERALKSQGGSSLSSGTISTELRFINYLLDDVPDIWPNIRKAEDKIRNKLQRGAVYSKLSAAVNVLKLWFSPEEPDEVISLGIVSDGTYHIPVGMVFSQPAQLKDGKWVPFPDFPMSPEVPKKIENAAKAALEILHA